MSHDTPSSVDIVAVPATAPDSSFLASQRLRTLLVLFFVVSGCAALVYEIVWFHLLSLIVGSSTISMGIILATFMAGMSLGSIGLSRFVSRSHHPLKIYAFLEVGIGVFGLLVLWLLPRFGGLYTSIGGAGPWGIFIRAIFVSFFLLPPTILMGATLPTISRWIQTTPRGVSWLGFLYGSNTVGAVVGCLLAGFYLIKAHDVHYATYFAVSINFLLAILAFCLKGTPYRPEVETNTYSVEERKIAPGTWPVLVVIAVSGMSALGAEVVWTRLLGLLLGATTYTFSLILGSILLGLGIGSTVGSWIARGSENPRRALGWCQLLLLFAFAWAGYATERSLPYWPIQPTLATKPIFTFELDFIRALWVVMPAALLWGASFPLALAAVSQGRRDPARMVGVVYAANTIGAIVGALLASMLLLNLVGTQRLQQVLIGLTALSALIALVPTPTADGRNVVRPGGFGWAVAIIAIAIWVGSTIIPIPGLLVAYGRNTAGWGRSAGEILFVGEGVNSSMAVSRLWNGVLNYHNAGKTQASSEPQDMRLQRMLGHLTTLIPTNPERVLVIGCGAGVTAGAVSIDPMVKHQTIAEIESLVPQFVAKHFGDHNFRVVDNPKVHIHIDDARHFLNTTKETFDAITSDPFDPWVKGAASLYTVEFFTLAKKKLNPGGVVTVFVQLYETGDAGVKSEVASFLEAFPNGMIFANNVSGVGYDTVLVGTKEPMVFDIDRMQARLEDPTNAAMRQSLAEIGFFNIIDLFATWAGDKNSMKDWLADAQLNRDSNLRLQYLAGLGLNQYDQDVIYRNFSRNRRWPEGLFKGSPETMTALRAAFDSQ